MNKHTPGPWAVISGESVGGWDEPGEYEYIVVTKHPEPRPNNILASFWDSEFGYEALANARLIATAPDLLAACKELVRVVYEGDWHTEVQPALNMARATIAKVSGCGESEGGG